MGAARVCFALSQLGGLSTGLGCVSQPTGHLGAQVLTHSPSWVLAQQLGTAASELSITRDPQLLLWGGEASGPREPLLLPISEQNTRLASSSDRKFGGGVICYVVKDCQKVEGYAGWKTNGTSRDREKGDGDPG